MHRISSLDLYLKKEETKAGCSGGACLESQYMGGWGRGLSVWGQSGLHSRFQDSWGYMVRLCLKREKNIKKERKES